MSTHEEIPYFLMIKHVNFTQKSIEELEAYEDQFRKMHNKYRDARVRLENREKMDPDVLKAAVDTEKEYAGCVEWLRALIATKKAEQETALETITETAEEAAMEEAAMEALSVLDLGK